MTGFGEARRSADGLAVSVEVRAINSRYFKLTIRSGEAYSLLEPQIESVVRERIKRGTIQVNLRVDRSSSPDDYALNTTVLASYRQQLEQLRAEWKLSENLSLESLLVLPGVVNDEPSHRRDVEQEWPVIRETLQAALENLSRMRLDEGRAMTADLMANCHAIATELSGIEVRAPQTVEAYRARLEDRIKKVLADHEVSLNAGDLIREISIYSERSDISEEIVRLRSHLEQFAAIVGLEESSGRKLEFLTQEMFRETNTIGSKSNDIEIARRVIEIKAAIERIREMIQNIE